MNFQAFKISTKYIIVIIIIVVSVRVRVQHVSLFVLIQVVNTDL